MSRALAEDLWYHGTDAMIAEASELSDEALVELSRLDAVRRRGGNQVAMSARRRAEIRWGV
jgi:glycerol-3-phosphate cytidylyltransferase-like family protein